ncbi:MAG: hypothetical protein QS2022_2100 [Candidatus Phytoplasma asteris]|nr:MAG: hypothetical protein PLY_2080 [Periwinkle leaf yellowing phytoplasma]WEX19486.1 MAG: hypothetical protein QS2022_2100 [Candidatus Phytoplasma asteris]
MLTNQSLHYNVFLSNLYKSINAIKDCNEFKYVCSNLPIKREAQFAFNKNKIKLKFQPLLDKINSFLQNNKKEIILIPEPINPNQTQNAMSKEQFINLIKGKLNNLESIFNPYYIVPEALPSNNILDIFATFKETYNGFNNGFHIDNCNEQESINTLENMLMNFKKIKNYQNPSNELETNFFQSYFKLLNDIDQIKKT